jgi:hypothetical protein
MAIIDVNLGSQSQTINEDNANAGDTLNISGFGTNELTVDGVSVGVESFAGVQAAQTGIFNVVNGGDLSVGSDLASLGALNSIEYNISDTSSVTLDMGVLSAGQLLGIGNVLNSSTINFSGEPVEGPDGYTGSSFSIDPPTIGFGALGSVGMNVSGFGVHDSISLGENATFGGFTANDDGTGGTLVINVPGLIGSTPYTFTMDGMDPDFVADLVENGGDYFQDGTFTPVCFVKGALIDTPEGPVAIEALEIGDKVLGRSGVREVKWIGWRNYGAAVMRTEEQQERICPVRIQAGALGENLPTRDLEVSPWHHLFVDGLLVRARDLVNGVTIVQERARRPVSYYHIELDQFDVVLAHGVYSEAWADGGNRDFFQNVDVTTLRPEDQSRRRAPRPGFAVLRDPARIEEIRARFTPTTPEHDHRLSAVA